MSTRAISTRRTQASSALSGESVVVYTSSGISVAGAGITSSTPVSLGVVTPGSSSSATTVSVSGGGPTITNIQYLDASNAVVSGEIAVSTAGGNILINGTGFVTGSNVYINNTLATNTFISSTQIRAICPATSAGNVTLMIFSPTNAGTFGPNVRYSGAPSWTTSAVSFQVGSAGNVSLVASSDSTLTYTLQAGSSLPTGISLVSSGYLSGTPTGYTNNTSGTIVLIATDSEGQATQQTITWTVLVSDPQFNYTTLLINADTGSNIANASTSNVFLDSSSNTLTVTRTGGPIQGSFSPFNQTGWSLYCTGSGAQFSTTNNVTVFGTGDFTIEMWINLPSPSTRQCLITNRTGTSTTDFLLEVSAVGGSKLYWHNSSGSPSDVQGTITITANVWHHIAVVRISGTLTIYVDGVVDISTAWAGNMSDVSPIQIGSYTTSYVCTGYISNLRMVNGVGVYTGAFTPPTSPLTVTQNAGTNIAAIGDGKTILLTCQSNRFADFSSNILTTFSTTVNASIQPYSPFGGTTFTVNSYSNYFSGSTDSLTYTSSTALGSGDFCIECWVYPTKSTGTNQWIWGNRSGGATSAYLFFDSLLTPSFETDSGTTNLISSSTLTLNQWYHIAVVRIGSGTNNLKMYFNGVQVAQQTNTNNYSYTGSTPIGYSTSYPMFGHISNLRIVIGNGVYTGTFTPPTSALAATQSSGTNINAITGTQTSLLTCQSTTMIDNSTNSYAITASSSPKVSTHNPFNQTSSTGGSYSTSTNGGSMYFNGSSDYVSATIPSAFGTSDFTIECWLYLFAPGAGAIVDFRTSDSAGASIDFYLNSSKQLCSSTPLTGYITGTKVLAASQWYHVALVRSGSSLKTYINGLQDGSYGSMSANITNTVARIAYGANGYLAGGGYISDVKIVKGTALYTAPFVPPPAPLTTTSSPSLLLNFTNSGIVDAHGTNDISTIGAAQLSTSVYKYGSASVNFSGTGSWLTVLDKPPLRLGNGDFTVEGWFYITALGSARGLVSKGTSTTGWTIGVNASNQLTATYTTTTITGTTTISANTWYHFALVRNGTATGNMKIYLNGSSEASSATGITTDFSATDIMYIGADRTGTSPMIGYMDDVRITKGYARYTANFTAPATTFAGQ